MTSPTSAADVARAHLSDVLLRTGPDDPDAFDQLYRLTNAKLYKIALGICGEHQAAEDVLHDVYATIWQRGSGWQPGRASPITWLTIIARNRAIGWRRSQRVRQTGSIDEALDIADPNRGAEHMLLANEGTRQLLDCLDELESRQRDAIWASFFDGMTHAELAIARAVPLGTMKSWIRRGLARLADCIGD